MHNNRITNCTCAYTFCVCVCVRARARVCLCVYVWLCVFCMLFYECKYMCVCVCVCISAPSTHYVMNNFFKGGMETRESNALRGFVYFPLIQSDFKTEPNEVIQSQQEYPIKKLEKG